VKREPALCYRLLRYLNSPLLGLPAPVLSIRHALNLLGNGSRSGGCVWRRLWSWGQEKSSDLVLSSLVRARFCELVAPRVEHGATDLFLMGMLSLMDAILAVPIGMVIEELSLAPDIQGPVALCQDGQADAPSPVYDLMVAREAGRLGTRHAPGETAQAVAVVCGGNVELKPCAGRTKSPAPRAPLALLNRAEADTLSTTPLPQAGWPWCEGRG